MADIGGIFMLIFILFGASIVFYRLLNYMKNNHFCDKIYAEG